MRALVLPGYCSTGRAVELEGGPLGLSGVIAAVLQAAVTGLHGGFIDAMLCWMRTEENMASPQGALQVICYVLWVKMPWLHMLTPW